MLHIEMRQGMHSVRAFNMTEQEIDTRFLGPLLSGQEFTYEGHDWVPRKTRVRIFDHPELQTYQLGMGRGWQSVERKGVDVTETILDSARRRYVPAPDQPAPAQPAPASSHPEFPDQPAALAAHAPAPVDALKERLIGRLFAGPVSFEDVLAMAVALMPDCTAEAQTSAAQRATLEILRSGSALITR
jgi:hypothetical protein